MSDEPKLSPGPWRWVDAPGPMLLDARGTAVVVGERFIAVDEADARAIAAAPRMVELLKRCRPIIDQWGDVAADNFRDTTEGMVLDDDIEALLRELGMLP